MRRCHPSALQLPDLRSGISCASSTGDRGLQHFVGDGVAHGLEPLPASRAMEPPLLLNARQVDTVVAIILPFRLRGIQRRTGLDFAAEAEFVNGAIATVGTAHEKRH